MVVKPPLQSEKFPSNFDYTLLIGQVKQQTARLYSLDVTLLMYWFYEPLLFLDMGHWALWRKNSWEGFNRNSKGQSVRINRWEYIHS